MRDALCTAERRRAGHARRRIHNLPHAGRQPHPGPFCDAPAAFAAIALRRAASLTDLASSAVVPTIGRGCASVLSTYLRTRQGEGKWGAVRTWARVARCALVQGQQVVISKQEVEVLERLPEPEALHVVPPRNRHIPDVLRSGDSVRGTPYSLALPSDDHTHLDAGVPACWHAGVLLERPEHLPPPLPVDRVAREAPHVEERLHRLRPQQVVGGAVAVKVQGVAQVARPPPSAVRLRPRRPSRSLRVVLPAVLSPTQGV